jgi:hypothetical protein
VLANNRCSVTTISTVSASTRQDSNLVTCSADQRYSGSTSRRRIIVRAAPQRTSCKPTAILPRRWLALICDCLQQRSGSLNNIMSSPSRVSHGAVLRNLDRHVRTSCADRPSCEHSPSSVHVLQPCSMLRVQCPLKPPKIHRTRSMYSSSETWRCIDASFSFCPAYRLIATCDSNNGSVVSRLSKQAHGSAKQV